VLQVLKTTSDGRRVELGNVACAWIGLTGLESDHWFILKH
jgi:hypothetical protein